MSAWSCRGRASSPRVVGAWSRAGDMRVVAYYALFRVFFFFQAEDGIRDDLVTGVQTCALPISKRFLRAIKRSFDWARDNPEEACKLHIQKVPEVALDDCVHSVQAVMTFVYTDQDRKSVV